jgi:hypothetical protein
MMQPRNHHRSLRNNPVSLVVMLLALGIAGCAAEQPKTPSHAPEGSLGLFEGCDVRLQDIAGALLTYYSDHNEMPANLKALKLPANDPASDLSCPVSHQPYIFDPQGLPAPDGKSRLVIYDAVPAHGRFRWAVAIPDRKSGEPLIATVVAVPEGTFSRAGTSPNSGVNR